jgi:hypothetical protein
VSKAVNEHRKEIAAGAIMMGFLVAILAVVTTYYFPISVTTTTTAVATGPCAPENYQTFDDAPVPGWQYFASYDPSTGVINSEVSMASCEIDSNLARLHINPSDQLAVDGMLGAMVVNVTSYPQLNQLSHDLEGFYVILPTVQVALKPGVTFQGTQMYYEGLPVSNGTAIPVPTQ